MIGVEQGRISKLRALARGQGRAGTAEVSWMACRLFKHLCKELQHSRSPRGKDKVSLSCCKGVGELRPTGDRHSQSQRASREHGPRTVEGAPDTYTVQWQSSNPCSLHDCFALSDLSSLQSSFRPSAWWKIGMSGQFRQSQPCGIIELRELIDGFPHDVLFLRIYFRHVTLC